MLDIERSTAPQFFSLQNKRNFLRILGEWRRKGGEREARVAREGRSVKNPACPHTIVQALPPPDTPSMTTQSQC